MVLLEFVPVDSGTVLVKTEARYERVSTSRQSFADPSAIRHHPVSNAPVFCSIDAEPQGKPVVTPTPPA